MTPNVRRARPDETPILVVLMREFYAESGYVLDEESAALAFAELLADDSLGRAWLVEVDEEPAGYAVLTLGYSMEHGGRNAFVDDLFVREPHRGRGLGRAALGAIMNECRQLGVRAVHLEVGRGDIAAANLTITEERLKLVDFSSPLLTGVKEIVIGGPDAPPIKTIEDLAGQELHLRPSSSYYQHVTQLNEHFNAKGLKPIRVVPADEFLEDSDLLEMVNSGLIPLVVVDDHKARFWEQVFDKITLYPDIAVHEGGDIGWAFRKNSPLLKKEIDEFLKTAKKGTLLGNIIFKRYLKENKWAKNALNPEEIKKYQAVVDLFKTYSDQYGFDYLMTAALAYQESQLDHNRKSQAGAIGIMQLLPTTAADKNIGIADIRKLENNVHAGHKYLRFLQDRYFSDPKIDTLNKYLFTFAAYNAGPAKVSQLRAEAEKKGLDPNVWFQNVEVIAAKKIGRETVQYVANIYKYYISYKLSQAKAQQLK